MNNFEKKMKLPNHIAIIPDGNRRWAMGKGIKTIEGHLAGFKSMTALIDESLKIGIKHLTFFCFSTENQNRPEEEIDYLKNLFKKYIRSNIPRLLKNNIKLNIFGNLSYFEDSVNKIINIAKNKTENCNRLTLSIALNYGARDEIINAVKKISLDAINNKIHPSEINEDLFENYLHTKNIPNPDLLIRTSGEVRLSNFLLWQIAYSELLFSEKLFPDFTPKDLNSAISEFQTRNRRFGK